MRPKTAREFKVVRQALDLTQKHCATMVGFAEANGERQVRRIENEGREVPDYAGRLLEAYLAGYRPPDWPASAAPKRAIFMGARTAPNRSKSRKNGKS